MADSTYHQFCPVAMAAEILCTRWTMVLVRELISGSRRFNDLRRGVPRMSSALLSKRLKELVAAGIIERVDSAVDLRGSAYRLTESGQELRAIVEAFGTWGQRWVGTEVSLQHLDPSLLMWDMRRRLDVAPLPDRRCVIEFCYPELARSVRRFWLVVECDGSVDLCMVEPGFEVDLYVTGPLRTMTSIWLGLSTVSEARESAQLTLSGDDGIAHMMQDWLGLSPFALEKKRAGASAPA